MRLVLCTAPPEHADALADTLLRQRLVACVNLVPGVRSKYWWKGQLCTDGETLLVMKTRAELVERLVAAVRTAHPYEVPEVVTFPIAEGNPAYLAWLVGEATGVASDGSRGDGPAPAAGG